MKPIVLAAVLSLVGAGVGASHALAADLPVPSPVPPANYVPATTYSWSGVYFGLNGGYGFGRSNWTLGGISTGTFNTAGAVLGGTFGANFFEFNRFVFGVETDFDWSTVGGNSSAAACAGVGAPAGTTCGTSNDWLSTARARAGYAFGRVLVYATGGLALTDLHLSAAGDSHSVEYGWTAGGGVEFAFADQWTAKAEYLFVDFGNMTCGSTSEFFCGTGSVTLTENVVRGGVNYKFSW